MPEENSQNSNETSDRDENTSVRKVLYGLKVRVRKSDSIEISLQSRLINRYENEDFPKKKYI